jgi:hypothetical protein
MTTFDRHYRVPRAGRVAVGVSYLVAVGALVLVLAESGGPLFIAISAVGAIFGIWSGQMAIRAGGIYETPVGIANPQRMWWRDAKWEWTEIDCFRSVGTRVYIVLRNGTVSPLIGVAQGYGSKWAGGETRDITAELNERLALWRSEHGASAMQPPTQAREALSSPEA